MEKPTNGALLLKQSQPFFNVSSAGQTPGQLYIASTKRYARSCSRFPIPSAFGSRSNARNTVLSNQLKLTRFHGHFTVAQKGVRDGKNQSALPGGIPPADGRTGAGRSQSHGAGARI